MKPDVSHSPRDALLAYTAGFLIYINDEGLQMSGYVRRPQCPSLTAQFKKTVTDAAAKPGPPRRGTLRRKALRALHRVDARGGRAV